MKKRDGVRGRCIDLRIKGALSKTALWQISGGNCLKDTLRKFYYVWLPSPVKNTQGTVSLSRSVRGGACVTYSLLLVTRIMGRGGTITESRERKVHNVVNFLWHIFRCSLCWLLLWWRTTLKESLNVHTLHYREGYYLIHWAFIAPCWTLQPPWASTCLGKEKKSDKTTSPITQWATKLYMILIYDKFVVFEPDVHPHVLREW